MYGLGASAHHVPVGALRGLGGPLGAAEDEEDDDCRHAEEEGGTPEINNKETVESEVLFVFRRIMISSDLTHVPQAVVVASHCAALASA